MKNYEITYYTEIGYCRRSIKQFSSDKTLAEQEAERWLQGLGLSLYSIKELK